jgi:hypothetical protein
MAVAERMAIAVLDGEGGVERRKYTLTVQEAGRRRDVESLTVVS